jgi:hypothetical protein
LQIQVPEPCTVDIAADGERHEASFEAGTYDLAIASPGSAAALRHLVAQGFATVIEDEPGEVAELERTAGIPVPAGAVEEVSHGDSQ